jgi:hypothetical protein
MIVAPVLRAVWCEDVPLDETERGAGGFGSTGEGMHRGQIIEPEEEKEEDGVARPKA